MTAEESFSKLLIRPGTRLLSQDQILAKIRGREFISIEKLDSAPVLARLPKTLQSSGAFTVGVMVEKSPMITSKAGKKFCFVKLSDLEKYDLNQLQKQA